MANQYSADVPKGFNVPKQVRLDSITGIQNELTLKDLGVGNNLAFKYYEGLKVYCKDEKTEYIWREVIGSEIGLLNTPFIYPNYNPIDGINYSGKTFNFFKVINNPQPSDGSETKLIAGPNITISGIGTIVNPYNISSTSEISETYINEGNNINITGTGIISDPYVINSNLDDLGIIKTIGNEVISPGQSLSIINNEVTGKVLVTKEYVQSIIPSTPDGSETKLNQGNNITITGAGTALSPYVINSFNENNLIYINGVNNINISGNGSISTPYIIDSTGIQSVTGNIVNITDPLNPIVTLPTFKTINSESIIGTGDIEILSVENLQKTITYPADFIAGNYIISNADNNHSIFIENGANNVNIVFPSGLMSKIQIGFIQKGTGDVTAIESGTTIKHLSGLGKKMIGIEANAYAEQYASSNVIQWMGNIKV